MQGGLKKNQEVKHALEQEMNNRELSFVLDDKNQEDELLHEQVEDSLNGEIDNLLEEIDLVDEIERGCSERQLY